MKRDTLNMITILNESVLTEKINKDNIEINDKIKNSMRSKSDARKNEPELKKHGLEVDYTPTRGTIIKGPNGRRVYDDKNTVYGPSTPGFNNTHIKYDGYEDRRAEESKNNAKRYNDELEQLKGMSRDDIIRKYNDVSTDEALKNHAESLTNRKKWADEYEQRAKDYSNRALRNKQYKRETRRTGHEDNFIGYGDRQVSKHTPYNYKTKQYDPSEADKVDYLTYLTKENKFRDKDGYINKSDDPARKLQNDYKEVKNELNHAKRHQNFNKDYNSVSSDEELEAQIQKMRDELEEKIAKLKSTNEENKTKNSQASDEVKAAQKKLDDYMAGVRASRKNK